MDWLLIAAETPWFLNPASYLTIFKVAVGLGLVIFVHELGHFLVAKACGVRCDKFYIGFDVPIKLGFGKWGIPLPRTLWKKKIGETEYGIGIIPLGGYVKMLGQDDNPNNAEAEAASTKVQEVGPDGKPTGKVVLDPRSYGAKSVPQRMAIISAGVIMNIIFAVIFATIAYRIGVSYMSTVVGSTYAGEAAWEAGLQPQDKIIQIGKNGEPYEHLRFINDLAEGVVLNGPDHPLDLLIQRGDERFWVQVTPRLADMGGESFATIGVRPELKPVLAGKKSPILEHFPIGKLNQKFEEGDTIVALKAGEKTEAITTGDDLNRFFAQHPDETVVISFKGTRTEDGAKESKEIAYEVTVPPTPLRLPGFSLTDGGITAIRQKSPAEGKLEIGDVITKVGDEAVTDVMLLPELLRKHEGKDVTLTVRRADKGELPISLKPEPPLIASAVGAPNLPLPLESIGATTKVLNTVSAVEPGSPAEKAGIQVGDTLKSAAFEASDEKTKEQETENGSIDKKPIPLGKEQNWPYMFSRMQSTLPDTKLVLEIVRKEHVEKVSLVPVESSTYHFSQRGLRLSMNMYKMQAENWGEAFGLGLRETKEGLLKVVKFLRMLATGRISMTKMGGPGTIAYVAGMEASESWARLLIFLTLLSANLAVVNFLPIPVLDGGHMVFLLYEGIFGKPPNERVQEILLRFGLAFILGLMLFVIGLDFFRFSGIGK